MRLKTSQILFLLVTLTVVTYIVVLNFDTSNQTSAAITKGQELKSDIIEKQRIFDRKNKPLSTENTTLGTQILLEEVRESFHTDERITLSIDSQLQDYIYGALEEVAFNKAYAGGAGAVMDIQTGELLALTTYSQDESVLNKATNGLFIPGSIIKPFIAIAALSEGVIGPEKEILSTGAIALTDQNGQKLLFNDWKPHGYVDMREALGVSSNVYFYAIGGGYEDQVGLGIDKITEYLQLFGIGNPTGIEMLAESTGQTPTPEWKEVTYSGDGWRLADTYLTSIGQHGYAVTPLQMVRAVGAIATEGEMVTPTITHDTNNVADKFLLPLEKEHFKVVKAGMEYAVINGTASGLYMDDVTLAAKTGTAEVDIHKKHIHSWLIGYFPHDKPRYAFVFMLDTGPWGEETGAVSVALNVFEWIRENRAEYIKPF